MANTNENNDNPSEHSFRTYILLCAIALVIAFGYMYLRNIDNTDFDKSTLKHYTCVGISSRLEIDVPFDLKDEYLDFLDETVDQMVYKIGASNNFRIEIIDIRYNFDVSTLSNNDIMEAIINFIEEDSNFGNITKSGIINVTVNGRTCARQTLNFYDKSNGLKLESKFVVFKKDDDIWMVSITYKEANKKVTDFVETIISSIEVK